MLNVNVKNENNKVKIKIKNKDILLLKDKETGESDIGVVISTLVNGYEYFDIVLFSNDIDNPINQWNNWAERTSIEELIESLEEYYPITKLEEDQFEINIDVKL